jgi:hypothetical protein
MWSRGNYSSHSIVCHADNGKPRKGWGLRTRSSSGCGAGPTTLRWVNHPWRPPDAAESPVFADENGVAWRPASERRVISLDRREPGRTGSRSVLAS